LLSLKLQNHLLSTQKNTKKHLTHFYFTQITAQSQTTITVRHILCGTFRFPLSHLHLFVNKKARGWHATCAFYVVCSCNQTRQRDTCAQHRLWKIEIYCEWFHGKNKFLEFFGSFMLWKLSESWEKVARIDGRVEKIVSFVKNDGNLHRNFLVKYSSSIAK
jgi:hypothetical protein